MTEGVKLQDLQIGALQRKLDEGHGRLKQQQTLYDAVKADRATYKKNLTSAHSEITDMKKSFDSLKASIESVKDEITGKDAALVREHSEHARVDREKVSSCSCLSRECHMNHERMSSSLLLASHRVRCAMKSLAFTSRFSRVSTSLQTKNPSP